MDTEIKKGGDRNRWCCDVQQCNRVPLKSPWNHNWQFFILFMKHCIVYYKWFIWAHPNCFIHVPS